MELGKILEFRRDLYFEGAVQADWFYSQEKAAKVAENFVFHGKQYFGVEDQGAGKKRIDTISLVEELTEKMSDDHANALTLAIADYGTGKSHLAVTLGQIFSGKDYMPETYNKILSNISSIDAEAAEHIKSLTDEKNFVLVINGMRDFNLHSEILKAAQKSLKLYGLPDDGLKKLNRALETAETFFNRNAMNAITLFEEKARKFGWNETGDNLVSKIRDNLMTDEVAFDIVNAVYMEINGQEIRWDEGLSASNILEMLISEYCGINGRFEHVILLFDEFGRYLEYASGVNAAKSGDSALQQIFETAQNANGVLQVINFIQSDIKTYLQRVDQTKNISRCIDQEFRVIPPEEKRARKVYDSIVTKINENKEYACKDIFDRFCRPPYGMSEDVVVLMIAVVCANLNYCLRFRCDESLTNINSWKELVVIKDKKIDIDVVKKSAFVMVDAGAVTGKYVRFFERIQSNKSISEVISLEKILANMMAVDEIPEELETQYLLARKYLDSGKKANNEWKTCIGEIDEKLEASIEESNLYDALKGLQLVEAIPYTKIFKDNGYELDEESKNTVKELISSLKSEVEQLITPYLANMYCKSVEGVNTFRNHNTKMQNMLEELGFTNYAMQVKRRKEEELSNIDEIRSRQELRADCEKYLEESQITRYVTYVNVCLYLKSGKELQARVKKYGVALGKDAQKIQENINDRMAALEKNHDRTMQDMSDIWDDLYEVKNADDVEMLIDNIASVLQKGIPDADRLDFEELQKNLSELLNDINEIKRVTNSRNEFKKISEDMINKYEHSEFDFEVLPIIHEVISDMENNMNVREQEWINSVLTLGDKSRKAVHKWKEKTAYLP